MYQQTKLDQYLTTITQRTEGMGQKYTDLLKEDAPDSTVSALSTAAVSAVMSGKASVVNPPNSMGGEVPTYSEFYTKLNGAFPYWNATALGFDGNGSQGQSFSAFLKGKEWELFVQMQGDKSEETRQLYEGLRGGVMQPEGMLGELQEQEQQQKQNGAEQKYLEAYALASADIYISLLQYVKPEREFSKVSDVAIKGGIASQINMDAAAFQNVTATCPRLSYFSPEYYKCVEALYKRNLDAGMVNVHVFYRGFWPRNLYWGFTEEHDTRWGQIVKAQKGAQDKGEMGGMPKEEQIVSGAKNPGAGTSDYYSADKVELKFITKGSLPKWKPLAIIPEHQILSSLLNRTLCLSPNGQDIEAAPDMAEVGGNVAKPKWKEFEESGRAITDRMVAALMRSSNLEDKRNVVEMAVGQAHIWPFGCILQAIVHIPPLSLLYFPAEDFKLLEGNRVGFAQRESDRLRYLREEHKEDAADFTANAINQTAVNNKFDNRGDYWKQMEDLGEHVTHKGFQRCKTCFGVGHSSEPNTKGTYSGKKWQKGKGNPQKHWYKEKTGRGPGFRQGMKTQCPTKYCLKRVLDNVPGCKGVLKQARINVSNNAEMTQANQHYHPQFKQSGKWQASHYLSCEVDRWKFGEEVIAIGGKSFKAEIIKDSLQNKGVIGEVADAMKVGGNSQNKMGLLVSIVETFSQVRCGVCFGFGHSAQFGCPTETALKSNPSGYRSWQLGGFRKIKHAASKLVPSSEVPDAYYELLFEAEAAKGYIQGAKDYKLDGMTKSEREAGEDEEALKKLGDPTGLLGAMKILMRQMKRNGNK